IANFKGNYSDAEIHTHDIFGNVREFTGLTQTQKYQILDNLYSTIEKLPITIVSVAINKMLLKQRCPTWDVFTTAWIYLSERFDNFVREETTCQEGTVRVDKSTKEQQTDVQKIISDLQKNKSKYASFQYVKGNPIFLNSESSEGIQIADAVAFCTIKHMRKHHRFIPYWNNIIKRMRSDVNGNFEGYGFKEFPQ
ncbi:MAG: DUF3800 domain-containing protein, partial [Patescibacteria group bacterium]|nr:DUF3800 domain-containing protein [Patescibacteria group bacterium]